MTVRRIAPAKFRGPDVPTSQEYIPEAAANFVQGAPVNVDGNEVDVVTGASGGDPILGFASEGVAAGVPVGIGNTIVVFKAEANTEFIGQVWDGSAVDPDLTGVEVGDVHPLTLQDGEWLVNASTATNPTVRITKLLPELGCVLFQVTHRQED